MANRVLQAAAELGKAEEAIKKLDREARKEKKEIPSAMYERLRDDLRLARRNLHVAEQTEIAMRKFPPLRVAS